MEPDAVSSVTADTMDRLTAVYTWSLCSMSLQSFPFTRRCDSLSALFAQRRIFDPMSCLRPQISAVDAASRAASLS